ncbi:MAG: glycoside hydrolase family 5 protein [Planctomycetes bacterium]|nr:glycoside hydrolase family 5 protein [Planctomycetota bacterium]
MRLLPPLCLLAALAAAEDPAPTPRTLAGLVVTAGRAGTLHLRGEPGRAVAWRIRDWDGAQVGAGSAVAGADGGLAVTATLPAGWHQLEAGAARLGVVAHDPELPPPAGSFFALDAALLEFPFDDARREDLAGQARALGFNAVRERLKWNSLQPEPGPLLDAAPRRDDALLGSYRRAGLGVLHVFHDTPPWVGRLGGTLPADLVETADAWRLLAARLGGDGHAIEAWNEPDSPDYLGDATADQLAATTRAVAWGARQGDARTRIVCGVFTDHADAGFRQACWDNRLAAAADVFSFHSYQPPERLEALVATLRQELTAAGEAGMPLWISESGQSWPGRPGARPEAGADVRSALAIAMRAVEARACGLERHYAFVYANYAEGPVNYGMTGPEGSALRSLGAYSHLARRLDGLAYAGDLAVPGARRARLFAGGGRAVGVVWLGDPRADGRLATDLPVRRCLGLDGRALARTPAGWAVPDGACLLELDPAVTGQAVTATAAMALWRQAQVARPRPQLSPILVQLMPCAGGATPGRGRHLVAVDDGRARLAVQVGNAAPGKRAVRLAVIPDQGGAVLDAAERRLAIAGPGWQEVDFRIRLDRPGRWRIAVWDGDQALPEVVVRLEPEVDGRALLARIPAERRRSLTAAELLAIDGNAIAGTRIAAVAAGDGGVAYDTGFPPSKPPVHRRWACPRLVLPADARFDRFDAVLLRVRVQERGGLYLYAFEGVEGNVGWSTPASVAPADGGWHWALVRLADLGVNHTERDPDGRLDPSAIARLGLGYGVRRGDRNRVEVGELVLLRLADGE